VVAPESCCKSNWLDVDLLLEASPMKVALPSSHIRVGEGGRGGGVSYIFMRPKNSLLRFYAPAGCPQTQVCRLQGGAHCKESEA